ncbi:MAG: hypothetical protein ACO248_10450, partial [Burkholderiaceae bacterium]
MGISSGRLAARRSRWCTTTCSASPRAASTQPPARATRTGIFHDGRDALAIDGVDHRRVAAVAGGEARAGAAAHRHPVRLPREGRRLGGDELERDAVGAPLDAEDFPGAAGAVSLQHVQGFF